MKHKNLHQVEKKNPQGPRGVTPNRRSLLGATGITYSPLPPLGVTLVWTPFNVQYSLGEGIMITGASGQTGGATGITIPVVTQPYSRSNKRFTTGATGQTGPVGEYSTIWNPVQGGTLVFVRYDLPLTIPEVIAPQSDLVTVKMPLFSKSNGVNTSTIGPKGDEVKLDTSVKNQGYNWVTSSTQNEWLVSGTTNVHLQGKSSFYQQNLLQPYVNSSNSSTMNSSNGNMNSSNGNVTKSLSGWRIF